MVSWPCPTNDLVESSRTVERSLGSGQLPHFVFGGDERSKLLGDQCVPCEKLFAVDRLAAIDPFEVVAQRSLNLWIFRLGAPRLIVQTPTPDAGCPRDFGAARIIAPA